jgi:phage-related protein
MPATRVLLFREADGSVPLLNWLDALPSKVQDKCRVRIERLQELGHEMRRPEADYLRNEIYELRVRHQSVNYRMLYFFYGEGTAVLCHALTKERAVPSREIDRAIQRRDRFRNDPASHTHEE